LVIKNIIAILEEILIYHF